MSTRIPEDTIYSKGTVYLQRFHLFQERAHLLKTLPIFYERGLFQRRHLFHKRDLLPKTPPLPGAQRASKDDTYSTGEAYSKDVT